MCARRSAGQRDAGDGEEADQCAQHRDELHAGLQDQRALELALQLLVTFLCGLGAIASLYAIVRIAFTA